MKERLKVFIVLILQTILFYSVPPIFGRRHPIRIIVSLLVGTFSLSFIDGLQDSKTKYLYPIAIAILFVPSVFVFYNATALIHAIWYLVVSTAGMLMGSGAKFIYNKVRGIDE